MKLKIENRIYLVELIENQINKTSLMIDNIDYGSFDIHEIEGVNQFHLTVELDDYYLKTRVMIIDGLIEIKELIKTEEKVKKTTYFDFDSNLVKEQK